MLSSMREEGGPPGLLGIVRVSDGAPIVWRAKWGSVQGAQDMVGGHVAMGWHQLGKVGGASVQEVLWQGHARPVWELVRYPLQVRDHLWVRVI